MLRKENIHIDYLIYFSNSNIFENKFKYIDPLFYFWTGKLLIDKPTTHPILNKE